MKVVSALTILVIEKVVLPVVFVIGWANGFMRGVVCSLKQ